MTKTAQGARYTLEFKQEAVRMVESGQSIALYFGMSLGLTFPFNILVGIPLYTHLALALL